jgi:hypothetical protein
MTLEMQNVFIIIYFALNNVYYDLMGKNKQWWSLYFYIFSFSSFYGATGRGTFVTTLIFLVMYPACGKLALIQVKRFE